MIFLRERIKRSSLPGQAHLLQARHKPLAVVVNLNKRSLAAGTGRTTIAHQVSLCLLQGSGKVMIA